MLVELGSGTSEKTRLLLDAMAAAPAGLTGYVPFDVAEATLRSAAEAVAADLGIGVHAVVGDFHEHLDGIPDRPARRGSSRSWAAPSATSTPASGARFLGRRRPTCSGPTTGSCWPPTWSSRSTG